MLSPADIDKLADALALRLERIIVVALERPATRRAMEGRPSEDQSALPPGLADKVLGAVAGVTGVSVGELTSGDCRGLIVVHARDVAAWAMKRSCGDATMKEVGEALGVVAQNARQAIARVEGQLDTKRERGLFAHRVALRLGIPGFGAREEEAEAAEETEAPLYAVKPNPQPPAPVSKPAPAAVPEEKPQTERKRRGKAPKTLPRERIDQIISAVVSATHTPVEAIRTGTRGVPSPWARYAIAWLLHRAGLGLSAVGPELGMSGPHACVVCQRVDFEVRRRSANGLLAMKLAAQLGIQVEARKAA